MPPVVNPPELTGYHLLDLIGCGGMGSVYIGYQLDSEKLVAIKLLNPDAARIPAVLEQFRQEGEILKNLHHQNIVKFLDQGNEGDYHYLVMDYVKGLSLDSFPLGNSMTTIGVKQTLPTMEEYLMVFIDCMEALGYVHKKGLVHRDIKPQNIILRGSEYKPCLIDFGIAKMTDKDDDLNLTAEGMYTVAYASPEQLTNKPVDYQSDLFSYGVVMYEKLTGHLPFKGKRAMQVFIEQTKWNFPPPRQLNPSIPQKLEQIVLKLLAKDPTQRYPTAEMVMGELERLLEVTRQGRSGLGLSGISGDIRGVQIERRGFKKRTISDEQNMLKRARAEFIEARQKLKMEKGRLRPDSEKIDNFVVLCNTLQQDYERLENQLKMALGFKSQPLVIDRFNAIFKLETIAFEKRGIPFNINTIEQKLATTEGEDIIVGKMNFTERAKRSFSINKRDTYLAWDNANWFFGAYEEKDFPIFVMIGNKSMPKCPVGFKGFFWPFEFLLAVQKLGWTGVSIVETFKGVDRNGHAVFAEHKETILFSQTLFDELDKLQGKISSADKK
ncbi:MAG: eukaryotic-like serine/threonine-protein kinase [Clostridiales bacterium]|nr:eukaryotic-like serine/threonine-protein kinase [Clostridiales bacterium]MDN5281661.1 eukaryotic-like serine/threonine-protein kinase [Candidatus Ozemobacter sp.]